MPFVQLAQTGEWRDSNDSLNGPMVFIANGQLHGASQTGSTLSKLASCAVLKGPIKVFVLPFNGHLSNHDNDSKCFNVFYTQKLARL